MKFGKFHPELFDLDVFWPRFVECKPKLLVVTDRLNYGETSSFGLSQFVNTLKSAEIHGMTPVVKTAHRSIDLNADLNDYRFDDSNAGVSISRYDVLFLFGVTRETTILGKQEVAAITRFMEAGGGVFATGDHEDLGASFGKDIPRVKNMRYWSRSNTPSATTKMRLSTNLPGENGFEEFVDQSDRYAQRLYLNYRTDAGGIGSPHPLLQSQHFQELGYLPDHPHEGECRIPTDLSTIFTLDGKVKKEWPNEIGRDYSLVPEMVALSMSHGKGFVNKASLTPRSFMSIVAYDGQLAGVGRVSTDATWHHFININIDGTGTARNGLQVSPGTDTIEMQQIREYYVNIASWLMPKSTRRCLRWGLVLKALKHAPLFEELDIRSVNKMKSSDYLAIGQITRSALMLRHPKWLVDSIIEDYAHDVIKPESLRVLSRDANDAGASQLLYGNLADASFGGLIVGIFENFEAIQGAKKPLNKLLKLTMSTVETAFRMQAKTTLKQLENYQRQIEKVL